MRPLGGTLLGLVATASLAGCGIDTEKAGTPNAPAPGAARTTTSEVNSAAARRLPKRPKGVVAVDGPVQGSLTPRAIALGVPGVQVNFDNSGEQQGFSDLCAGRIDVLDTSREISRADQRACSRNGLDLVRLQVASDAVVIATRNESDVGGDCLRISTVRDIFEPSSPLTNWSQVGFFDIPLRVTGREPTAPAFQFFGQSVLGVQTRASLGDVRRDYIEHDTDDEVRREVTSEARVDRVNARFRSRIRSLEFRRSLELQAAVNRAVQRAKDRMLARFESENNARAADQVVLSPAQKLLISRSNLRRINRATRAAQLRAQARFSFPELTFVRAQYRYALRRARISGTIGVFRFSYYELYENLLRPMEIWDPVRAAEALARMTGVKVVRGATATGAAATTTSTGTTATTTATTATTTSAKKAPDGTVVVDPATAPWCVFPSQTTITNGSYPLSRPLYLYVSRLNLERDEVQRFLKTFLDNAQALASRNRLVPIPDTLLDDDRALVSGEPAPSSTSAAGATATTPSTTTIPDVPGVASPGSGVSTPPPSTTTSTTSTTTTPATTSATTTTTP